MQASQTYFARYKAVLKKDFDVYPHRSQKSGVITEKGIFKATWSYDYDYERCYFDFSEGHEDDVIAWFPL